MENKTEEKGIYSFRNHLRKRLMALFLVVVMLGGSILAWRIQIRETGLEYVGTVLERAQQVTDQNTSYLTQSALERAWRVLRTAVRRPRSYEEFETYASLAIAKGDYAAATEYMQGCIDQYSGGDDGKLANLWLRKGSLYTLCSEEEKAIECYDKALEIDNTIQDALLLRAQMNSELGNAEAAADDLISYEKLAGSNPLIQAALGGLYESIGNYDAAVKCYTVAIDSENYDAAALASRARCLILTGGSEAAGEDLERFFREGGEDETGDNYAMLGMCRMEKGDYPGALKALHSAIRRGYSNPVMLYEQCVACAYVMQDYDTVIKDGGAAVELAESRGEINEGTADIYQWIGYANFIKNDYAPAAEAFEKALALNPALEYMNYYAGISCMSIDKPEKAVDFFRKSADLGEYPSICMYDSGLCRLQLEDYEGAKKDLEEAIEHNDDKDAVAESRQLLSELQRYLKSR